VPPESVTPWPTNLVAVAGLRLFGKHYYTLATTMTTVTQHEKFGTHALEDFYQEVARNL
jgi:hypothetical protein